MKAHVGLMAVALLLVAGCGEPDPIAPDRPTASKPTVTPPPEFDRERPHESAVMLPEFIQYEAPIYILRNRPVFDGLVRMENGIGAVEAYLKPVHPRLRIDWSYLIEQTANIELGLTTAINDHLDTALNQKPKGGVTPAFGMEFHRDLVNLHAVTRRLHWAATAQDLQRARWAFESLTVQLGPRPAVLRAPGQAAPPVTPAPAATPVVRDSSGDDLIKGKDEQYGDLAAVKLTTDIRTRYAFWPAPAGAKTQYLTATPKPKQIDYTLDMTHSVDFDTPKYPEPRIVNTRDLRDENEYSRRLSTTETR